MKGRTTKDTRNEERFVESLQASRRRSASRVTLRSHRRLTLPREVCEVLSVKPGDRLVLEVSGGALIVRSQQQVAMEALEAVRRGLAESGVSLEELLESGRQIRDELFRENYPDLAEKYGI